MVTLNNPRSVNRSHCSTVTRLLRRYRCRQSTEVSASGPLAEPTLPAW
jgi:hypothetical protein